MTTPAPDYRRLFGGDPGGYDRARPDYPSRVYEILTNHRQDLAALLDLLLAIPD